MSKNMIIRRVDTAEVADRLGCHLMSVYRFARKKPGFPQPIKLFGKLLWDVDELEEYIAHAAVRRGKKMEAA